MNIAIYKPYKKVYFYDDKEDTAAWSYEVVNLCKIFAKFCHNVIILSESDYDNKIQNITNDSIESNHSYDRIIIFSGVFDKDIYPDIIQRLRKKTTRLDFYYTDMRLFPDEQDFLLFDNQYSQSTSLYKYGGVAELLCFEHSWKSIDDSINEKEIRYYFGGTERNRLKDYLEYVYRPNCVLTGKSASLGFDTRVKRDEYFRLLNKTKYSIVIADEQYNTNGFITPRHYENILHDIISFVDYKFDINEYLIKKDDWRRVKNFVELLEKMTFLDNHFEEYKKLLLKQRTEIKESFIDGSFVYKKVTE